MPLPPIPAVKMVHSYWMKREEPDQKKAQRIEEIALFTVSPPTVITSNVITPTVEKTDDGFQIVSKKKKKNGKSKSSNDGQFAGPSVKPNVRYEPKATISAPNKGATDVGNASKSSSMWKTTCASFKNDNIITSNSYSALNDEDEDEEEDVENVYDETANLFPNTKVGGSSSFTTVVASPYHSQVNCQAEVANKQIVKGMKKLMEEYKTCWVDELLNILWTHQTTPKESTGETFFSLVYGTEFVIPIEVLIHTKRVAMVTNDKNKDSRRLELALTEEMCNPATICLEHSKHKMAKYYNKRFSPISFKPEDYVMRKNMASKAVGQGKLAPTGKGHTSFIMPTTIVLPVHNAKQG
nr:hypothetical protein [Tanacetum cinerariifolium]